MLKPHSISAAEPAPECRLSAPVIYQTGKSVWCLKTCIPGVTLLQLSSSTVSPKYEPETVSTFGFLTFLPAQTMKAYLTVALLLLGLDHCQGEEYCQTCTTFDLPSILSLRFSPNSMT